MGYGRWGEASDPESWLLSDNVGRHTQDLASARPAERDAIRFILEPLWEQPAGVIEFRSDKANDIYIIRPFSADITDRRNA